jgi:hypothetical protein
MRCRIKPGSTTRMATSGKFSRFSRITFLRAPLAMTGLAVQLLRSMPKAESRKLPFLAAEGR